MTLNSKTLELTLPDNFRRDDFIAFHSRDSHSVAERCDEQSVTKAVMHQHQPMTLGFHFDQSSLRVQCEGENAADFALQSVAETLLGLDQGTAEFEAQFSQHPEVGALLQQRPGLRVPQSATPFEALLWAIIGQQISVIVAINIRRRLIQAANQAAPNNLLAFPDVETVMALSDERLRETGLSRAKLMAVRALCDGIASGELPLDDWLHKPEAELIYQRLLALKGIGPWTVNYALLRGFNSLDGSLHGDVAVRKNLGELLALNSTPDAKFTEHWLAQFSPWRALMAAHLWARANAAGY
ncbi:hypothetical protein BGP77_14595 [Saccharospirillum sp. MSK14-1]|uniref:DNA-3-methyladenine glycosylase 2 n=1 Tax=Saccharospirillum sp. MSK14-1 TaxID=1897632 RepID=UPI000D338CA5|nr:DNA-3-methyladenine glycosylase 2 [Saccharospirillum sp. MSK14-1]PTY37711.1 hypothetical protein BGP77_14595 [Saccharospirillum sp. MSK14-1]